MSAIDTILRISENENLFSYPFRYCLVSSSKIPYTVNNDIAHPNKKEDFCSFEELIKNEDLELYQGVGISIIESKITAIDVDKCFSIPFDINSADERAKEIINFFKDKAYIEFSFSGRGLRILFYLNEEIENYTYNYYIKNDKNKIEFYLPYLSPRYVTLTGKYIYNNSLYKIDNLNIIYSFLNKYMVRPKKLYTSQNIKLNDINNDLSINELMKKVKSLYLKDIEFQDLWFMTKEEHFTKLSCHIQGESKESNTDFRLLSILYQKITNDKDKLKELFEMSPYFKSKDKKHTEKWLYGNYRYYDYMYERLD